MYPASLLELSVYLWEPKKPNHTLRMFNFLYILPLFAKPAKCEVGLLSVCDRPNSDTTGQVQARYMPCSPKKMIKT